MSNNNRSSPGPASKLKKAALKALFYPLFRSYVKMPGRSFKGNFMPLASGQLDLRDKLAAHVKALATDIGERHHMGDRPQQSLSASAQYIAAEFAKLGLVPVITSFTYAGVVMFNVEVVIPGRRRPKDFVVVGAHYDTVKHCPGADDNGSGIAGVIALAELLKDAALDRSIRLVAYANEEDSGGPWEAMGSYHHAAACKARGENVVAMISLEMIGYYDRAEGSQKYPFPFNLFYPTRGDFIAFVGNTASRSLVHSCVAEFRAKAQFPSEGVAAPERFRDVARSDHWSYWQMGYQALMVTDTSNFRNPYLHTSEDTPDKVNFDSMTRVVVGMEKVVRKLATA